MTVSVSTKSVTFTNGTANDAGPVDSEFTNVFNSLANVKTKVDNLLSGKIEDGLSVTIRQAFTGSPGASDHLSLIAERGASTNTVVRWNETLDWWEVSHNGSNYYPVSLVTSSDPASPTEGMVWYNTTSHVLKYRDNSATRTLVYEQGYPTGYIHGPAPTYNNAASITIPAGLRARNAADTADIVVGSNITLSLASSGAAGLDTGSEASGTWYYVYLIRKSSDGTVSAVFSVTNEKVSGTITYPSGYDQKRQLPFAVKNDGSSNIIKFYVSEGWPFRPVVFYDSDFTGDSADPTSIGGGALSSATFAAVDASAFIPAGISRVGFFHFQKNSTETAYFRPTGSSATSGLALRTTDNIMHEFQMGVDSSGQLDYKVGGGDIELSVRGFVVTEIF